MVLPGDQIKVTDFGIARILQPDTSLQTFATTGMRMGTPLYMAPEQIEGKKIDGRTDIYALGAMLYHMVTGRPPFEGSDALTVAVKHLQDEPVAPSRVNPDVPQAWDGLILKALAKDPRERFQSAGEMAQAVQELPIQHDAGDRRPARPGVRALVAGASTALIAGIVAVGAILFWPHPTHGLAQSPLAGKLNAYLNSLASRNQISGTVLVARKGQILVSRGFGLADRAHRVPNVPATKYQGFGFNTNIVAALKLEEQGKIHGSDHICAYLPSCPANWRPITIHQVLDGTSGLFDINWPAAEGNTAQSLNACHGPLQPPPSGTTFYGNCDVVVLGTIIEKVTGEPWATAMQQLILGPAGMQNSGRLTDALRPPARGNDYDGSVPDSRLYFNSYFALYAPAPDDLAYDQALFGGKLLSARDLLTLITPRDSQPDPGIPDARQAYKWRVGHIAGQQVVYTLTNAGNAVGVNLWFPHDRTAVIVLSNVLQDDPVPIAVNLSKLLYGRTVVFPVLQAHVRSVSYSRAVLATIDAQAFSDAPAFSHHAIWLPNDNIHQVTRISTLTEQVTGITTLTPDLVGNPGDVSSVASDGSHLWVAYTEPSLGHRGLLARLDPVTGKVLERIPVPGALFQISMSQGIVWGTSLATDNLIRVDTRTHHATQVGKHFGSPVELVVGGGSVWVSTYRINSFAGALRKIDARTGRVLASLHVGTDPESLALGFGSLWVVNGTGGYISRIDPRTNRVAAQIALGSDEQNKFFTLHSVAIGYGAVWVAVHKDHKLVRIDPATNRVTSSLTLPIPTNASTIDVWDLAIGDGSVWIHAEPHLLYRVDPKAMASA
jgi:CubicO group peptidase (beta-lactamase class C family)/streptogramin lyase